MAQQTINVGASPNDGTGTPLRTAFQYTNSNFTELYTATGPSGNNIVVPGSATITGDLTVDTSTLKVDSSNDRVGIGTASPAQFVHLSKSNTSTALTSPPVGGASLRIQNTSSTNNNFGSVEFYNAAGLFGASVNCQYTNQATPTNDLVFVTRGSSGGLEHYRIAADGVATWSEVGGTSGTAMTLNSTGLGVGVSPATKLDVRGTINGNQAIFTGTVNRGLVISTRSDGLADDRTVILNAQHSTGAQGQLVLQTVGTDRLLIDSSGNVGIGVTPVSKLTVSGGVSLTSAASNHFLRDGTAWIWSSDGASTGTARGGLYADGSSNLNMYGGSTLASHLQINSSGDVISKVNTSVPTVANSQMVFNLTTNTNLRITVRGADGTLRSANITLAP